jgi:hypothetical protein
MARGTSDGRRPQATDASSDAEGALGWGLGLLAGALAVLPALVRGAGVTTFGLALCSMALAAPLCAGLRRLGGVRLAWLAVALLLSFGPLSLLGEWLSRSTHHRPLGAVTFAVFAAGVMGAMALCAWRALGTLRTQRALFAVAALSLLLGVALFVRAGLPPWFEAATWLGLVALGALLPKGPAFVHTLSARGVLGAWFGVLLAATLWTLLAPVGLANASPVLSFPLRVLLGQA